MKKLLIERDGADRQYVSEKMFRISYQPAGFVVVEDAGEIETQELSSVTTGTPIGDGEPTAPSETVVGVEPVIRPKGKKPKAT